jgi:hypothetical protein
MWTKHYGGSGYEAGMCVRQTSDGGYIIAGETAINDPDGDGYLIKTDANGDTMWTSIIGGSDYDLLQPVFETADGGYITAGYTLSWGAGGTDAWLVKTNSLGDTLWTRTYGGPTWDVIFRMDLTTDGGYILCAATNDIEDLWIIKTDSMGNVEWDSIYGGSGTDVCGNVHQLPDGGYFVSASTYSFGPGGDDFWLLRIDSVGNVLWDSTYGGTHNDELWDSRMTSDGGVIMTGGTMSYGAGNWDFFLIRVDSLGNTVWQNTYGGTYGDMSVAVNTTSDGDFVATGYTRSFGAVGEDVWLVKAAGADGHQVWDIQLGGSQNQRGWWVEQTSDDCYVTTGYDHLTAGNADVWLIMTEPDEGIEERKSAEVKSSYTGATVFSGPLRIPEGTAYKLFDIMGREVTPDKIRPGVYFVEVDGQITQKVIRIR